MLKLGCDCYDLVLHPKFAEQLVARFDPFAVQTAMLVDGEAAVALSDQPRLLEQMLIDADTLLRATVGNARAARTVADELARQGQLASVCPDTFVEVGLQRKHIRLSDAQLMAMRPSVEAARALGIY